MLHSPSRHRLVGSLLLLPLLTWSLSGLFFLVRPGYQQAYEQVPVYQYPLPQSLPVTIQPHWRELRYLRSVLGEHVLVRDSQGWTHLRADTGQVWPLPDAGALAQLLGDAFRFNPDRYGQLIAVNGNQAHTDTGVELQVHWNTLTISQRGRDSRWIDRIYSLHYLQWTGLKWPDRILGVTGLLLLCYLSYSGARMIFTRQHRPER